MRQSNLHFTPAQLRALLWLPADGKWRHAGADISPAVLSLVFYHSDLASAEWGIDLGLQPRSRKHYRLTPAGIAEQARQRARVG